MTKIIFAIALTIVTLQAQSIVKYDTKETKKPEMTKPNHPSSDIY